MIKYIIVISLLIILSGCMNESIEISDDLNIKYEGDPKMKIKSALDEVSLKGKKGKAFLIFDIKDTNFFIQFALQESGFVLYFPKSSIISDVHIKTLKGLLEKEGFQQAESKDYESLNNKEFYIDDKGLSANFGDRTSNIEELTIKIINDVFGIKENFDVNVDMALNG